MTEQGQQAAAAWQERDFARSWAEHDGLREMLAFPRRIATAVVAGDIPEPGYVVDVASGPGELLAAFLEAFPSAQGLWIDASEAMLELGRERLASFGSRIEYRIADMTDLAAGAVPYGVDVITTSRAAHHLNRQGLVGFYTQAASLLRPGGWLVNLDHIGPSEVWDGRLRAARKLFRGPGPAAETGHHHDNYPLTSVRDHLDAYAAAGIRDVEVVWRAFITCLFMGRRDVQS